MVVGLWNHVLIMIQNPLCPTPLAPKKMLRGGFGDFYFYEIATAVDGFGFNDNERMRQKYGKRIPPGDPGNLLRAPSLHRYPLEMRRYPLEKRRYPLEKGIWHGWEIPANSILAAASK
jgi:hypothetical protein